MAFPRDRLPLRHELAFGAEPSGDPATWQWTDVSTAALRQEITIRRGRQDEASQPQPTSASVQLDNPRGDFTPGHPMGAYYPNVRQGVPYRVSVQAGGPYLRIPGDGATCTAPPSPTFNTTDLDVRVELALDRLPGQWGATAPSGETPWDDRDSELIARYLPTGDQRSWRVLLSPIGSVWVAWTEDGTLGTFHQIVSDGVVPYVSGQRCAIRVTLDVDNGSGGHTASFWHAPSLDGPWLPLGDPITVTGTTSIYTSTAPVVIGDLDGVTLIVGAGRYYQAELRAGIDGTVVASPDFTTAAPGDTSVTDAQGVTWTLAGGAVITDWRTRMVGTVDEWAPTWPYGDLSQGDYVGEARTDITISGILRRLGQGQQPLQSTLRRRVPSATPTPVAYWPMEDGRAATSAASALPGGRPLTLTDVQWAADDSLGGSAALPTLGQQGRLYGRVTGAQAGGWQAEMVYHLETMPATEQTMLTLTLSGASGGVVSVRVRVSTAGIRVQALDQDDAVIAFGFFTDPAAIAAFIGSWNRLAIFSYQSGASCYVRAGWRNIADNTYWYAGTTWTGTTVGRVTAVQGTWGADFQGMPIGHLAVWDVGGASLTAPGVRVYDGADDGYQGEYALGRMRRLAQEEALPFSVLGSQLESPPMGPQGQATLIELIQECVSADGGILSELRETIGLQYRPRYLLYNQRPALQLSARTNEIDAPFTPVLDDQRIRNLIQVTRQDGSSAVASDPDSIAEHGLYDDSITLNLAADDQAAPIAYWRLYRGTWPGMRYPAVTTALDVAPQTIDRWMDRAEGDRILVSDLPPQHPTDTVDLMVEGTTETLSPTRWSIEANASPGGPWTVGEVGGDDAAGDDAPTHVDTDGSELNAAITATDTQLIVLTTTGLEWTTTAGPTPTAGSGDFPFDVRFGGEVATAGACEPMMWDDFQRTVSGGWGTTPGTLVPTPSWLLSGGSAAERSVAAGQGRVTLGDASLPRFQFLSTWTVPDCEQLVTVTVPAVATGASLRVGIAMRISGSNWYEMRADLAASGAVGIEVARTGTSLTGVIATGATYAAGTVLRIRARVDGQRVRGRVWVAAQPEPGGWQADYTVTTGTIATGQLGLVASRATGNTNASPQFAFSAYQVVTPQLMTVIRSVNGVSKSHATGTDLRLANPMIIAL